MLSPRLQSKPQSIGYETKESVLPTRKDIPLLMASEKNAG